MYWFLYTTSLGSFKRLGALDKILISSSEKCGLCPITIHFSRPLIGGRLSTVVQDLLATHIILCHTRYTHHFISIQSYCL